MRLGLGIGIGYKAGGGAGGGGVFDALYRVFRIAHWYEATVAAQMGLADWV